MVIFSSWSQSRCAWPWRNGGRIRSFCINVTLVLSWPQRVKSDPFVSRRNIRSPVEDIVNIRDMNVANGWNCFCLGCFSGRPVPRMFICYCVNRVKWLRNSEVMRNVEDEAEDQGDAQVRWSCHSPVLLWPIRESSSMQPTVRHIRPYNVQTQTNPCRQVENKTVYCPFWGR